jgi:methionyl-tRNA formyltransferase
VKIVYFGTSAFACPALQRLATHPDFEVVGVVTQPDRPAGRTGRLTPPPVKLAALDLHCKVFQPESLKSNTFVSQLKYMRPDFSVVASYGKILHKEVLDLPQYGSFNIHASLLPKYRGAAPIQRAIMDGCDETGVTIMKMDEGLDTGEIVLQQSTHIRETDNVQVLHDRLGEIGADLIVESLPKIAASELNFTPQNEAESSYAKKITREDERIVWDNTKRQIWNQIRALHPGPGAYTFLETDGGASRSLKILTADYERNSVGTPGEVIRIDKQGIHIATSKGSIIAKVVQPEGKKKMTVEEFLNGNPLQVGQRFLSSPLPSKIS